MHHICLDVRVSLMAIVEIAALAPCKALQTHARIREHQNHISLVLFSDLVRTRLSINPTSFFPCHKRRNCLLVCPRRCKPLRLASRLSQRLPLHGLPDGTRAYVRGRIDSNSGSALQGSARTQRAELTVAVDLCNVGVHLDAACSDGTLWPTLTQCLKAGPCLDPSYCLIFQRAAIRSELAID